MMRDNPDMMEFLSRKPHHCLGFCYRNDATEMAL